MNLNSSREVSLSPAFLLRQSNFGEMRKAARKMSKDPVTGNLELFIYTIQVPFNFVIKLLAVGLQKYFMGPYSNLVGSTVIESYSMMPVICNIFIFTPKG